MVGQKYLNSNLDSGFEFGIFPPQKTPKPQNFDLVRQFKILKFSGVITGKSFSEALILATTKPQYDKRLFIDLKFIYSEKATKFCEIFPLLLTTVHTVTSKGKISQNFEDFSEYMNFTK